MATYRNPATFHWGHLHQNPQSSKWQLYWPEPKPYTRCTMTEIFQREPDFTIELHGYSWRVHLDIMAEESRFFKALKTGRWQSKESKAQRIVLHDDSAWAIARMIQFCYTQSFSYTSATLCKTVRDRLPTSRRSEASKALTLGCVMSHLHSHPKFQDHTLKDARLTLPEIDAMMYCISDKYGIPKLRTRILQSLPSADANNEEAIVTVCSDSFRALAERDYDLKVAIADRLARCYSKLQREHSLWIERWVQTDPTVALLMMDRMKHVDAPLLTVQKMNDQAWIEQWDKRPLNLAKCPSTDAVVKFSPTNKQMSMTMDSATQTDILS